MAALPSAYVPDFGLAIDGSRVPAAMRASVSSVRLEQSLQGASRVEVQLADPDLRYLDDPQLRPDSQLDLLLGYQPGPLVPMFSGDITGLEPSFPANGMPTLGVTAHDFLQRLTAGTKNRGFDANITDSVVAAIVAAENQLIKMPDPATAAVTGAVTALGRFQGRPTRIQYRRSDLDFLRSIAAEYGIDLWLEGRVLFFRIQVPGLPPPEVELRRGESLVEFTPRLSSVGQVAGVRAQVYIESLRTQLGVEVGWDGSRLSVRVVPAYGQAGSGVYFDLPDVPVDQPIEAIRRSVAELRRRLNSRVTGRGTAIGDPRLRAGSVIAITGLGSWSGANYRLTSVTHVLDGSGYRTSFEVRQEVA